MRELGLALVLVALCGAPWGCKDDEPAAPEPRAEAPEAPQGALQPRALDPKKTEELVRLAQSDPEQIAELARRAEMPDDRARQLATAATANVETAAELAKAAGVDLEAMKKAASASARKASAQGTGGDTLPEACSRLLECCKELRGRSKEARAACESVGKTVGVLSKMATPLAAARECGELRTRVVGFVPPGGGELPKGCQAAQ